MAIFKKGETQKQAFDRIVSVFEDVIKKNNMDLVTVSVNHGILDASGKWSIKLELHADKVKK